MSISISGLANRLCLLLALTLAPTAWSATTYNWAGPSGSNWSNTSAWSPSTGVPSAAGDIAQFNSTSLGNQTVNLNGDYGFQQLKLTTANGNYELTGSGTLTLSSVAGVTSSAVYNGSTNRQLTIGSGVSIASSATTGTMTFGIYYADATIEFNGNFASSAIVMGKYGAGKLILGGTSNQQIQTLLGGGEVVARNSSVFGNGGFNIGSSSTPTVSLASDLTLKGTNNASLAGAGHLTLRLTESGASDRRITMLGRLASTSGGGITIGQNTADSSGNLTLELSFGGGGTNPAHAAYIATRSGSVVEFSNSSGTQLYGSESATAAIISGGGSVRKSNSGALTIYNAQTYSGATTITGGTLALASTGALVNTPAIDVAQGAAFDVSAVAGGFTLAAAQTLKGNGTVRGDVQVASSAVVAPGSLSFADDLAFQSGAIYAWEAASAASYDALDITGSLTAAGPWTLRLDSAPVAGTFTIATAQGGIAAGLAAQAQILNLPGGWGWSLANDAGNQNLLLTLTVPEPASIVALAATMLLGLGRRR